MASVVVVGGGIVGLTTAYYLTKKGQKVTLLEKCAIACHSSGKAGGFLTDGDSGWHRGPIAHLAKHSFKLHEELAGVLGADAIGYRRVRCVGRGSGQVESPDWLKPAFKNDMGDQSGLAQVSPLKLMDALSNLVKSQGCEVVIGKAVGVELEDQAVTGVKAEHEGRAWTIPCSAVVLGMGAWAKDAADWFPDSCMPRDTVSSRYTSVIWDDVEVGKDATMVFISDEHHVEIYPRADECYANGCPTSIDLPDNPLDIVPPPQTVEDVKAETFTAVERLREAKVIRTTACFLAGSEDSKPVIGMVPKMKNAVIACGGGCWGILNGACCERRPLQPQPLRASAVDDVGQRPAPEAPGAAAAEPGAGGHVAAEPGGRHAAAAAAAGRRRLRHARPMPAWRRHSPRSRHKAP